MADIIPDEREILKTDLWKRDNEIRASNVAEIHGLSDRLDGIADKLKGEIWPEFEKGKAEVSNLQSQLEDSIRSQVKFSLTNADVGVNRFKKALDDHIAKTESRLLAMDAKIKDSVAKEVANYFEKVIIEIHQLSKRVDDFQSSITDSFNKGTQAANQRLEEAEKERDRILDKFRIIGKELGE